MPWASDPALTFVTRVVGPVAGYPPAGTFARRITIRRGSRYASFPWTTPSVDRGHIILALTDPERGNEFCAPGFTPDNSQHGERHTADRHRIRCEPVDAAMGDEQSSDPALTATGRRRIVTDSRTARVDLLSPF